MWRWFRHYVVGIALCLVGAAMVLARHPLQIGQHRLHPDNVNMVGVAVITGGIFALRFGLNRRMRERHR